MKLEEIIKALQDGQTITKTKLYFDSAGRLKIQYKLSERIIKSIQFEKLQEQNLLEKISEHRNTITYKLKT